MDYKEHIFRAVKYIERNLTNELDVSSCARASGYSEYHFLRVFKEVSGLTPADYIRKRRLSEITKQIYQKDDEYISEIAFRYGFNSKITLLVLLRQNIIFYQQSINQLKIV